MHIDVKSIIDAVKKKGIFQDLEGPILPDL
jgi:hypothetical protein